MAGKSWSELLVAEHEMIERAMDVLQGELAKLARELGYAPVYTEAEALDRTIADFYNLASA